MKRLCLISLAAILAGCGGAKTPEQIREENAAPTDEHLPADFMFNKKGCLTKDMAKAYAEDMPCLDPDNTGCVTRARWKALMGYWDINTPEAGIGLCEQYRKRTGKLIP